VKRVRGLEFMSGRGKVALEKTLYGGIIAESGNDCA
jgi:hypothetical protein